MVKTITFVKRRPELERDEFLDLWRNVHTPLVRLMPGLRRLCNNFAFSGRREPYWDVVVEAWWENLDGLVAAISSRAGMTAAESIERMADAARLLTLTASERVMLPAPLGDSFVKEFVAVYRRPDLSFAEFDSYWCGPHGSLACTLPGLLGYVQCPAMQVPGQIALMDGCTIAWFSDMEARHLAIRKTSEAQIKDDSARFLAKERMVGVVTLPEE